MTAAQFEAHVDAMHHHGYTVLPGILTMDECARARRELQRLRREADRGGFECLFNKARIFERPYQVPDLLRLIRHFLAPDAILSGMHGSIIEPGGGGGGLHADGELTGHLHPHSQAAADQGRRITSHVLGLNTIFCISEFTSTNGATRFVRGSHRNEGLEIPPTAVEQAQIVEAECGSTIVFNTNIWHGASENRSAAERYALLVPWRRTWERAEYEMSRVVKPEVLERAGAEGQKIFAIGALPPYLERWQWDREKGAPKPEFSQLVRA